MGGFDDNGGFGVNDDMEGDEEGDRFDAWINTLIHDVVEDEFGYEPGEFTVDPEAWRWAFDEGLTPLDGFKRALKAAADARKDLDRERVANYERIKAEDAELLARAKTTGCPANG